MYIVVLNFFTMKKTETTFWSDLSRGLGICGEKFFPAVGVYPTLFLDDMDSLSEHRYDDCHYTFAGTNV